MKKVVALLFILIGFTFNTNAQEKKTTTTKVVLETKNTAKEVAIEIKDFLRLDKAKTKEVFAFLQHKDNEISELKLAGLSPNKLEERQVVLNKYLTKTLEDLLTSNLYTKLQSNKALFNKAIN